MWLSFLDGSEKIVGLWDFVELEVLRTCSPPSLEGGVERLPMQ